MTDTRIRAEEVDERAVVGAARWRRLGLVRFACDTAGRPTDTPPGLDWLSDLICHAPLACRGLETAATAWCDEETPGTTEILPGLWMAPTPVRQRREVVGFSIVAIPTAALLERLGALCEGAQLDETTVRRQLEALPPAAECDVERLATLAQAVAADDHVRASNASALDSVSRQLAESYEEINLLYTMNENMTGVERPEVFVSLACRELRATLPYAWIATAFRDDARLERLAGRFFFFGDARVTESRIRELATALLEGGPPATPLIIEPGRSEIADKYGEFGDAAIVQPLVSDGHIMGLLIAGEKQGDDTLASSEDMKLLDATASCMTIFLENAALYGDLNAMFLGTLEALTASIDAKDRYTCGHSRRVAHLTRQLARAVDLDESAVDRTHIAGLVHDVGKIGVPERVLLKPGRLTEDEFVWIRRHPEMGFGILKDIPQLEDVLPGVLHHHERWDGGGYPSGLAGEKIPLLGRLIALADAFDAMSSDRTYRPKMGRPEVLEEIRRCAGSHFDPNLVPAFVALDFSEFDELVAEHRAHDRNDIAA